MKRMLWLLAFAPLLPTLSSCDDENSLPQVELTVAMSNAEEEDGIIYVLTGTNLVIDGIYVEPEEGTKAATLGPTSYYWDYNFLGTTVNEPFGLAFNTETLEPGRYLLQVVTTVFQVDKSVATATFTYPVMIVDQYPPGVRPDVPGGGDTFEPDITVQEGQTVQP